MKLEPYQEPIQNLCQTFNVKALYVIGSVARGDDTSESDIDFVVSFNNLYTKGIADRYFDLQESLEKLFKKKVDLIEETAIKNPIFKNTIERDKVLLYG